MLRACLATRPLASRGALASSNPKARLSTGVPPGPHGYNDPGKLCQSFNPKMEA